MLTSPWQQRFIISLTSQPIITNNEITVTNVENSCYSHDVTTSTIYIYWEDSVSLVLKWLKKRLERRLRKFPTVTDRNDRISNCLFKIPRYVTYTAQGLHWTVILVEKPRIHKAIVSCTLQGRGNKIIRNNKEANDFSSKCYLAFKTKYDPLKFPMYGCIVYIMPSLSTCVPLWWTHLMKVLKKLNHLKVYFMEFLQKNPVSD